MVLLKPSSCVSVITSWWVNSHNCFRTYVTSLLQHNNGKYSAPPLESANNVRLRLLHCICNQFTPVGYYVARLLVSLSPAHSEYTAVCSEECFICIAAYCIDYCSVPYMHCKIVLKLPCPFPLVHESVGEGNRQRIKGTKGWKQQGVKLNLPCWGTECVNVGLKVSLIIEFQCPRYALYKSLRHYHVSLGWCMNLSGKETDGEWKVREGANRKV